MMLWDAGIQLYANVYYATDEELESNADALARFLTGSAMGWGYAKDNPEDAANQLVAEYPNLDLGSELEAIGPVLGFSFNDTTAQHGWGAMNAENWAAQIQTYSDLDQFQGDVPTIDDVMTLDILDAIADIRMKVG